MRLKKLMLLFNCVLAVNALIVVGVFIKKSEIKKLKQTQQGLYANLYILSQRLGQYDESIKHLPSLGNIIASSEFVPDFSVKISNFFIYHRPVPLLRVTFSNATCNGKLNISDIKYWTLKQPVTDPTWKDYEAVVEATVTYVKCNGESDSYQLISYESRQGVITVLNDDDIDDKQRIYIHAMIDKIDNEGTYRILFEQHDTQKILGSKVVH